MCITYVTVKVFLFVFPWLLQQCLFFWLGRIQTQKGGTNIINTRAYRKNTVTCVVKCFLMFIIVYNSSQHVVDLWTHENTKQSEENSANKSDETEEPHTKNKSQIGFIGLCLASRARLRVARSVCIGFSGKILLRLTPSRSRKASLVGWCGRQGVASAASTSRSTGTLCSALHSNPVARPGWPNHGSFLQRLV